MAHGCVFLHTFYLFLTLSNILQSDTTLTHSSLPLPASRNIKVTNNVKVKVWTGDRKSFYGTH